MLSAIEILAHVVVEWATMLEPIVHERGGRMQFTAAHTPSGQKPDQHLRATLAAIVRAAIDGALPADGGFARAGLRREIATYAADRRAAGFGLDRMLAEFRRLIEDSTAGLEAAERQQVTEELIGWAIEAF